MKKVIVFLLLTCILFSAAGCSVLEKADSLLKPTDVVFAIDSYQLQITADSSFQEKTSGSFDLQITNGSSYISIMAYRYMDLPDSVTPLDVYDMQNEDLLGKRTAVAVMEETKTETVSRHTVTQTLYSAEKDGVKNYYASYLIDFSEEETLAWVLVSATPSYLTDNREYLDNIVCSLTTVE